MSAKERAEVESMLNQEMTLPLKKQNLLWQAYLELCLKTNSYPR